MFYGLTVAIVAAEIIVLMGLKGTVVPFPNEPKHLLKLGLIILCPGLNIFYGIGIIPYFFHPNPYRIHR